MLQNLRALFNNTYIYQISSYNTVIGITSVEEKINEKRIGINLPIIHLYVCIGHCELLPCYKVVTAAKPIKTKYINYIICIYALNLPRKSLDNIITKLCTVVRGDVFENRAIYLLYNIMGHFSVLPDRSINY